MTLAKLDGLNFPKGVWFKTLPEDFEIRFFQQGDIYVANMSLNGKLNAIMTSENFFQLTRGVEKAIRMIEEKNETD